MEAAVSASVVAQWPSPRAQSVGTQLEIEAAVSMSVVAQWPSRRAQSVGTEQDIPVIQDTLDIGRGWEMVAVSMSLEAQ